MMHNTKTSPIALTVRIVVGVLLLAAAGGLFAYLVKTKPKVEKSSLQAQVVRVQVIRTQPIEVARQWRGYGTTMAKDSADVPARVNATVTRIPDAVEVGKVVSAGDTIAELDPTDFQNAFDAAEKRIAQAQAQADQLAAEQSRLEERLKVQQRKTELSRAEFERQAERMEQGSATQSDVDRAEQAVLNAQDAALLTRQQLDAIPPRLAGIAAQLAQVTAERDTAKANLERTIITSPIDGIIESLDIEVGENLMPGARVARIIDPRRLEVAVQLPASAYSYVTAGDKITLTTRSQPDDCPPWKAVILPRNSAVQQATRTFTAFAEIDQTHIPLRNFAEGGGPYRLQVGAFVLARLDTDDPKPHTIIPARAIQEGRIRTIVNGSVVSREVDVLFDLEGQYPAFGVPDTQWFALEQLLDPSDLVVLSASLTILDGQAVEPVIANAAPDAASGDAPQSARNGGEPEPDEGRVP